MKLFDILEIFKNFGFTIKEYDMPDIAFSVSQSLKGVPKNKIQSRYEKSFIIELGDLRLLLSENNEVFSDILYYDPDHKHYFYSYKSFISKIYHENDINDMYLDIIDYISENFDKSISRGLKIDTIINHGN
jgi:hypothetical protein